MNTSKTKRILNVIAYILVYAFLALAIVSLVFAMFARSKGEGAVSLFGRQVYTVATGSMEKCEETDVSSFEIKDIPINSAVFVECVPTDKADKRWAGATAWPAVSNTTHPKGCRPIPGRGKTSGRDAKPPPPECDTAQRSRTGRPSASSVSASLSQAIPPFFKSILPF